MRLFVKATGSDLQAPEYQPASPAKGLRRDSQPQIRDPAEQGIHGDLSFQAGERRRRGKMDSLTERQVPVRLAGEVQCIGPLELPRSRLADAITAKTISPRGIVTPAIETSSRETLGRRFQRAIVPEQLFDRRLDERRIAPQPFHLVGMFQERQRAVSDQVDGGLMTGDQEQ